MFKWLAGVFIISFLAGCNDEGNSFVGQWKSSGKMPETITVSAIDSGYRVVSKLDEDTKGYMNVELLASAESSRLMVREKDGKRALEIDEAGNLTSYLRHGVGKFTKVK